MLKKNKNIKTPSDADNLIELLIIWTNIIYDQPLKIIIVVVTWLIINFFFSFSFAFLIGFFLFLAIFKIDGYVAVFFALISLVMTPVLLLAKQEAWAESSAINAYFLLWVSVSVNVVELITVKLQRPTPAYRSVVRHIRLPRKK